MEFPRLLTCLDADRTRLREVVAVGDLASAVPSCPGWTTTDLVRHVATVYLHKSAAMRDGVEPDEGWPPPGLAQEEPMALLDRAYAELTEEFDARDPADHAGSWYGPDQTVGFWIRRMAQETVIHRIDAELAAGVVVAPVPDDLADDGTDEFLKTFVAFAVHDWGEYFTDVLGASPGRTVLVRTDGAAWTVRTGPGRFDVEDGATGDPDLSISGTPAAVQRWVWNRGGPDVDAAVTVEGDPAALAELRGCMRVASQ